MKKTIFALLFAALAYPAMAQEVSSMPGGYKGP
jgi:hypothetical protein